MRNDIQVNNNPVITEQYPDIRNNMNIVQNSLRFISDATINNLDYLYI